MLGGVRRFDAQAGEGHIVAAARLQLVKIGGHCAERRDTGGVERGRE